ncbi:MAG TPA: PAS domain-containing protein, partial [Candidatus Sabulitectum sp.]|nr:PAS domain-containing protein [Candidatus Sabulitectum sp.]
MAEAYYRVDEKGTITEVNLTAVSMFGYSSAEEMKGLRLTRDFFPSEEMRSEFLSSLSEDDSITSCTGLLKRKDGSEIHCVT